MAKVWVIIILIIVPYAVGKNENFRAKLSTYLWFWQWYSLGVQENYSFCSFSCPSASQFSSPSLFLFPQFFSLILLITIPYSFYC